MVFRSIGRGMARTSARDVGPPAAGHANTPGRVADGGDTLERATRFGHHFDPIAPAGLDGGAAAPIQRAPVVEHEAAPAPAVAPSEAAAVSAPTGGGGEAAAPQAPLASEGGHDQGPSASTAPAQEVAPPPVDGAMDSASSESADGTSSVPKKKSVTEVDRRIARERELRAKARERVTADVMKAHVAKGGPKFPVEKLSIEEQKKLGRKDLAEYKLWHRAIREAENGEYKRLGGKKSRGGTFRAPLVDQRTWLKDDGSDRADYGF